MTHPRILVIGVTGAGRGSVPVAYLDQILTADLLVGGSRQLDYFPEARGERLTLTCGIGAAADRLRAAQAAGQRAVVLASGDPLCYGIGSSLRRFFAAEELLFVPAPTAYQLAFAALGEAWHDAALLSAHNRPLDTVVAGVRTAPKAAILTDDRQTPAVIAQALLEAGLDPTTRCAVCENLGDAEQQRVVMTTLTELLEQTFAPLNVLVVWNSPPPDASVSPPTSEDTDAE